MKAPDRAGRSWGTAGPPGIFFSYGFSIGTRTVLPHSVQEPS